MLATLAQEKRRRGAGVDLQCRSAWRHRILRQPLGCLTGADTNLDGEPGNRAVADVVAAGDLPHWFTITLAASDRLALRMRLRRTSRRSGITYQTVSRTAPMGDP